MEKGLSIVLVDKRPYRKIAQDNWGLTNEQMVGMHVHHRVEVSKGGTDDPSNLYVCSPSMHRWGWHNGEAWVEWASRGGKAGAESCSRRRKENPEWAKEESARNSAQTKASHQKWHGTPEYSNRQRMKSIKLAASKRTHWEPSEYEFTWECHLQGVKTGYHVAKLRGTQSWKSYANMLKCASSGLTFEQATVAEKYLEEKLRLLNSPIAHILDRYDD